MSTQDNKVISRRSFEEVWNQGKLEAIEDLYDANQVSHGLGVEVPAGRAGIKEFVSYRTQGLQIGSGTIESGCKHLISARLKQAGMIWSPDGVRSIAKLRARLKSRRWDQTIALHSFAPRSYSCIAA